MSFSAMPFSVNYNCYNNISLPRKLPKYVHVLLGNSHLSSFSCQSSIQANLYSRKQRGLSLITFDSKNSEPVGDNDDDDDNQAMDAVMKLYSAFKNKNVQELSDILADECRCVCNFLSFFQSFQGKTQVLELFSYLIRVFGDNVQIVVKPTLHDGMNVGVHWKFEWNNIHIPLGKGFSFHICQTYRGKAVIKNIEMFMEPLLYLQPFKMIIVASLKDIVARIGSITASEESSGNGNSRAKRILGTVLALLFLAGLLLFVMKLAS